MSYQSRMALSLGAALLFSVSSLHAQSAEEIVKKHNEAVGGAAAWKKVNSLRMTGNMTAMGTEVGIVISKQRDVGMRQDLEIMGAKNYVILTPEKGWLFFPVQGMSSAQEAPAEEVKKSQSQLYIGDLILEMSDHGYKFESAGISTLDGKPVVPGKGTPESDQYYRLKAIDANGDATDLYIDMKTYYLVKTSRMVSRQGQEAEAGASYANYQKLPEGVVVPMSITTEMGETKLSKVEINPGLEASIFKP